MTDPSRARGGSTQTPSAEGRSRIKGVDQLAVAVLPSVLVVLTLLLATGSPRLAPDGLWGDPWLTLWWTVLGAVAAIHRPLSTPAPMALEPAPTLGLGAWVLPPVLVTLGTVPAALVAAAALLAAEVFRQALRARLHGGDALGSLPPAIERAVLLAFSVLLMGTFVSASWVLAWPRWAFILASAALFFLVWSVLVIGVTVALPAMRRRRPWSVGGLWKPMMIDGVAWAVGWGLADRLLPADAGGVQTQGMWVWGVLGLLSAEAGRNAALRDLSDHRVGHFERLRRAHERILSETTGMGDIARQIHEECHNILPVQWFQMELADSDADSEQWLSWAAGPDELLVEGRPRPPKRPGMLPGIHRRADWSVIERSLVRQAPDDGEVLLARLRLWCDPRRVEPGAEERLDTLVPQMASSLHRAQLDREAKLDPLTGVPVRRVLENRMQRAYRRCLEEGVPMAVIMCDIDFFKKVNDTYGHSAGDEALKLVAATLDGVRRESDLCCRYGGEEFTVLLERTQGDDALRLAERLRLAVEALRFEYEAHSIPLTLSLGVAAFPELHIKTVSELLLLADEALYEAKERGRNQCLLHIGNGAFRPPPGSRRQESATAIPRPEPGSWGHDDGAGPL